MVALKLSTPTRDSGETSTLASNSASLALDRGVFVGEVEHRAGLGQLVVDVGEAEQLFLAEDFAFGLAGRDDLARAPLLSYSSSFEEETR